MKTRAGAQTSPAGVAAVPHAWVEQLETAAASLRMGAKMLRALHENPAISLHSDLSRVSESALQNSAQALEILLTLRFDGKMSSSDLKRLRHIAASLHEGKPDEPLGVAASSVEARATMEASRLEYAKLAKLAPRPMKQVMAELQGKVTAGTYTSVLDAATHTLVHPKEIRAFVDVQMKKPPRNATRFAREDSFQTWRRLQNWSNTFPGSRPGLPYLSETLTSWQDALNASNRKH